MRRTILITGAGGYLGHELINQLLHNGDAVLASTSNPPKLHEDFLYHESLKCISRQELLTNGAHWSGIYAVVHLAFARRFRPNCEIADSIQYSRRVFELVKEQKVPRLINISSQSVYGNAEELRTENTVISPEMIYSMAKYAGEVVLDCIFQNCDTTATTNIRLDPIAQNQNLLPRLIEQALEKGELNLVGGGQIFSLLDIRDAAAAFIALLNTPAETWKGVYNVGCNNTVYTLVELADVVARVAQKHNAGTVKIGLKSEDIRTYGGMDSTLFTADTGWLPRYSIEDIIERSVEEYLDRVRRARN